MALKFIVPVALGAALMSGTTALASDYRPDQFFTLDLPKAVLSPKLLGPESHFEPVPVEAKADPAADKKPDRAVAATQPQARPDVPRSIATPRVRVARPFERAHGAARTKLAHRHGNPLDAQAMDTRIQTRIQTWPCRPGSGGICNWR
jgi:hypothetical protein